MADYTSLKVPDLKKLLQERSLPVSGNKAELIARLQSADSSAAAAGPAATTSGAPAPAEDEIDWDDDDAAGGGGSGAKPSEPAAAALAAGGQGQVANPAAVPNQKADVDPSKTDDLKVAGGTAGAAAASDASETAEPKAAVEFSAGLAQTDLEKEIALRKKRAQKFGVVESNDEAIKALERAKKFGTGSADEQLAGGGLRALDQALSSEKPSRKRGRDGRDGGRDGRDGKRQNSRRGGQRGGADGGREARNGADGGAPAPRGKITDDPVQKAKAEARAQRFAKG